MAHVRPFDELPEIYQFTESPQIRDVLSDVKTCGVALAVVEGRLMIQRQDPPPALARMIRINAKALTAAVELEQRLTTGEMRINRLDENDPDRESFEEFWAHLLTEYESACLVMARVPPERSAF